MNEMLFPDLEHSSLHSCDWTPTRAAGLSRLAAFTPNAGLAYARTRNADYGPEDRSNVSTLSPWLSRRLITEQEVVAAVLNGHRFVKAEKFIQEVFWRTYWKGWLELRPDVLVTFNQQRLAIKQTLKTEIDLAKRVEMAMSGHTGIECFDVWVSELRTFGWLHNHARMWFASIWIFTLNLPWQLGADFFYKHLMDADVASNTLSWRWVAGLQTKGKHYLARSYNIKAHTDGRFNPEGQLNETAPPLTEFDPLPGPSSLLPAQSIMSDRVGLLITQDDLHPESLQLQAQVVGAACLRMAAIGEPGSPQTLFTEGALKDAYTRAEDAMGVDVAWVGSDLEIVAWAQSIGVREIVTAYVPTGLVAWRLKTIRILLKEAGIDLVQVRRKWDSLTWPLATGGFFKLKEKIPQLIGKLV